MKIGEEDGKPKFNPIDISKLRDEHNNNLFQALRQGASDRTIAAEHELRDINADKELSKEEKEKAEIAVSERIKAIDRNYNAILNYLRYAVFGVTYQLSEDRPAPVTNDAEDKEYAELIEREIADYQITLGKLYFGGTGGVAQNYPRARKYFEQALNQSHNNFFRDTAYLYLGRLYSGGRGGAKDEALARKYLENALQEPRLEAAAQQFLGELHLNQRSLEGFKYLEDNARIMNNPLARDKALKAINKATEDPDPTIRREAQRIIKKLEQEKEATGARALRVVDLMKQNEQAVNLIRQKGTAWALGETPKENPAKTIRTRAALKTLGLAETEDKPELIQRRFNQLAKQYEDTIAATTTPTIEKAAAEYKLRALGLAFDYLWVGRHS